jgi:hypothetical protein
VGSEMITLTALIKIPNGNKTPFIFGKSILGSGATYGKNANVAVDKRNAMSIERSIFYRGDVKLPSWGILSNNGKISFNDKDGRFLEYAESGNLESGIEVELSLNNKLAKREEKIGVFYTDNWNYDNNNKVVSVSLKDDLEEWQDISVSGINYDPRKPQRKTMRYFYEYLYARTPKKYNLLKFAELDEKTREILESTVVEYPLLNEGNLWQQWVKVCQVCSLYIYKNNKGKTVCRYTYGS